MHVQVIGGQEREHCTWHFLPKQLGTDDPREILGPSVNLQEDCSGILLHKSVGMVQGLRERQQWRGYPTIPWDNQRIHCTLPL